MWKWYEIPVSVSLNKILVETVMHSHLHSVYCSFKLWPQSWVVVTETGWSAVPWIFTLWPLQKTFAGPCFLSKMRVYVLCRPVRGFGPQMALGYTGSLGQGMQVLEAMWAAGYSACCSVCWGQAVEHLLVQEQDPNCPAWWQSFTASHCLHATF